MKKIISGIAVYQGDLMPAYYGFAYRDINGDFAVFYPVPLNLIVAMWRSFYAFLRCGGIAMSPDPRQAYRQGFEAGRKSVPQ